MPDVAAHDGVTLHWEERGSGPAVLLSPYWSMHPSIFDPIEAVLAEDFRVVRYDERGTGRSERTGPYDMATGVEDLRAICEAAGPFEVAICLVDSSNRAVRIADPHPELLRSVFCVGSAPFGVGALRDSDSLLASEAVVQTFLRQLKADYRGAVRAALSGANTHLAEDEIRERVQLQMEYIDAAAAAERAEAWAADASASEPARAIGPRLRVCLAPTMGGTGSWFPSGEEMEPVIRELFPEAEVNWASDGLVSAADEVADLVREAVSAASSQAYHPPG